jgi:hypothetical protein
MADRRIYGDPVEVADKGTHTFILPPGLLNRVSARESDWGVRDAPGVLEQGRGLGGVVGDGCDYDADMCSNFVSMMCNKFEPRERLIMSRMCRPRA